MFPCGLAMPASVVALAFISISMASPTEKLPGFWRGRELPECLQVLPHDRLCGHEDERVLDEPLYVITRLCWRARRVGRRLNSFGARSRTNGCIQTSSPSARCSMNTALYWS